MDTRIKAFAAAGFAIHWLRPREKSPIAKAWQSLPRATVDQLERTWREGKNVGVRLGEPSDVGGLYLHVIDMDARRDWRAARAEMERLFPEYEDWPTVQSGSGGESRHFYFLTDKPFASKKLAVSPETFVDEAGVKHRHWEIELFGTGKQVAMPPSIHPSGGTYRWVIDFDLDDLEMGLGPVVDSARIEALVAPKGKTAVAAPDPMGLTHAQAREVLAALDVDEWCEDREGWLKVGMALEHEFGEEGWGLWAEFSEQSAKWDEDYGRRRWDGFSPRPDGVTMRSIVTASGVSLVDESLVDLLEDLPDEDEDEDEAPRTLKGRLEALNQRHALVMLSGTAVVLTEPKKTFSKIHSFHAYYENDRVPKPGSKIDEPISQRWMRWTGRRTYDEVVFDPRSRNPRHYNLWSGWTVAPNEKARCDRFIRHMQEVICSGERAWYDWLMDWFAHMIQKPWEKPGTAAVLIGRKGTGKDLVGKAIGGLFKENHVVVGAQSALTSNFNSRMAKALLFQLEEAVWAGSKNADSILKHYITAPRVSIEPKGVDAYDVDNFTRYLLTSNEAWVVPASADERRYFVLEVKDDYATNDDYMTPLWKEIQSEEGMSAILWLLQNRAITSNVRLPITTPALEAQKRESLEGPARWWQLALEREELCGEEWGEEEIVLPKSDLFDDYARWASRRRYESEHVGPRRFWEVMSMLSRLTDKRMSADDRRRVVRVPAIEEARSAFDEALAKGFRRPKARKK